MDLAVPSRPGILHRRGAESYDEACFKGLSECTEEPENTGGLDVIPWPSKRAARSLSPRPIVNPRLLELQVAKQILGEIFHARPSDVEEMIQNRLEERSRSEDSWQEEEELWPREFCLGE